MNHPSKEKKQRGRPTSFDRQNIVETVMDLFWQQGYRHLSFNEIAQETGLTRASLYNTFKTKEALFIEALQLYVVKSQSPKYFHIQPGTSVGTTFFNMLDEAAVFFSTDKKNRGCLLINSVSELSAENTELAAILRNIYKEGQQLMTRLVQQAIDQNELAQNTDPVVTANMIMAFMNGFTIISKSGLSEEQLKAIAHNFLTQTGFTK